MNVSQEDLLKLIQGGENLTLEFKECKTDVTRSVYETVCAFLNRHGGTILLGVRDAGHIQGIHPDFVEKIKKDFITNIHNPQKISPPAYLSIDEIMIDNKIILRIYVPESSQVHRCNGRIYDRNGDSDLDVTNYTIQVAHLYHRKQAAYSENKVYPYIGLDDLRKDLIDRCRKLASIGTAGHPWAQMSDLELIQSAQLYQVDPDTKKSGITMGGVLLLGSDQLILSTIPHHRTDLILRKVNIDRYDDRDLVRTNLIDSYDHIIAFIQKHLPDPFFLEGIERISLRDIIFREVASNLLIHREYTNAFPAKLIIEYGQVRTENASIPHGFGMLNPATLTPFPKNPVIGAFFREIHRADELGSGSRKLIRYGKIYGGADPELIEGDIFRTTIKVPEYSSPNIMVTEDGIPMITERGTIMATEQSVLSLEKLELTSRQKEIITILQQTEEMSLNDINKQLQKPLSNSTLRDNLANLKKMGIINSRGRARATTWFLVEKL